MSSINKIQLLGYIGEQPEINRTPKGTLIISIQLVTSTKKIDKLGRTSMQIDWHPVLIIGKLAEMCKDFISKDQQVLIDGVLHYNKVTSESGKDTYVPQIVTTYIHVLDRFTRRESTPLDDEGFGNY